MHFMGRKKITLHYFLYPHNLALPMMEWEKELKDLFRDLQDDSVDRNEDLYEIAEEKITALYGADADQKTLEELKKDDKYAEIEKLMSISKKTISKSDMSEFATDVARFIQHSKSSPGGWYWPLVKSVKIKIPDRHELLEHIVIVDIPGTGDCNKTRDDLWKSKLRECSSVWIVSAINRATDDKDPWGILKHCSEELGPGGECKRINFICTKTDDINPVSYMSSNAFFDTSLNLESAETEIPKLQDVLRSINKSINRELTRDYVSEAKGVLSLIQSVQLDTDKKAAETKVAIRMDLENNLKKALIEIDKYFDSIYNDLEKCLSKGVNESVQKCVASAKALVAPETKLKASLNRETVELKKDIYLSIIKTIQNEMAPCYEKAAALTGIGSMKERQEMLVNTVDENKQDMFDKAKMEVLKKLKHLKMNIKDVLEPGLKKAMDLSLSQSSNTTLMDVSSEIDQMEALLKQLSD
ncbi:nuclear GTPase SLIP-GC-like protein [Labeo rohita]|uniref:Nuclear GTPase SLIP-GC-like protein n=1 Tax=Labeo rohita TaxID=84645 RepID=A0A498M7A5_LABRO|nr:nuclear GTPase SLIP-GC-like protein [Labeo rohita]